MLDFSTPTAYQEQKTKQQADRQKEIEYIANAWLDKKASNKHKAVHPDLADKTEDEILQRSLASGISSAAVMNEISVNHKKYKDKLALIYS